MHRPVFAEDVGVGDAHDLGTCELTLDDVRDFSARWDPHDPEGESPAADYFDGPIASGLHSMAVLQRLSMINLYGPWAIVAARRIIEVRFHAPARPGMTLHGSLVVRAVEPRGTSKSLVTVAKTLRGDGTVLLTAEHEFYMLRQPAPRVAIDALV